MSQNNYLVVTVKPWNIDAYYRHTKDLPGNWHLITEPEELKLELLQEINPRYIFFPHWSWIVSNDLIRDYECVCFHMTDVPYGRGGSPLQNLISRGFSQTKLTALRMLGELDAGPVYGKLSLSLEGRAEDIFKRVSSLCYEHIKNIVISEPKPEAQTGEITCFPRRKPEQSEIPRNDDLSRVYDHIRMLDAPSYPKAFIEYGGYVLEFTDAELNEDSLGAKVTLTKKAR